VSNLARSILMPSTEPWPALPLEAWADTRATLHMWTQIVGKVRLELHPRINHWWHVTLYVSPRGLTTAAIPYRDGSFEVEFDFLDHQLRLETSRGERKRLPLQPQSVADFYRDFMAALRSLGIEVRIHAAPDEVPEPIPFAEDRVHHSYDPEYANRFWRILMSVDSIFREFRSPFLGKCSPVHFFWGSFDLAVTRFSGRRAPERPGADGITREAYSHECSSVGFWPGVGEITAPMFYAYTAPEPQGYAHARVQPGAAFYHDGLHEFFLKYDDVRQSAHPREMVLEFCQSTYEAGANLGRWDRDALERR
jgi:Family of unknown function (DUF5996)